MVWKIADLDDDAAILEVLNRDRIWAVYAICDLDQPYREHARYVGARHDGLLAAVVLLYQLPEFAVLVPCGDPSGVQTALTTVNGLPDTVSFQIRDDDLRALESRYHLADVHTMARMVVSADALRAARPVAGVDLRRLGAEQGEDLIAFYGRLPGRRPADAILQSMVEEGIYYGAFDGKSLVAVAGTHAISDRFGMATVGGVFTVPAYRGRGLAQATTGAVVQALVQRGIAEIALNVRADNTPAVVAYRRLGFEEYCRFLEGDAGLRSKTE